MAAIPLCYYPTTIVLVDDKKTYLKSLATNFWVDKKQPCLTYSDPREAVQFLKNKQGVDSLLQNCLIRDEDTEKDHIVSNISLTSIRNIVYQADRFREISVVVSDYAMSMNGLEFFAQFNKPIFKRMLLTGEADELLATNAFNNGLIDRFLRKDAQEFEQLLSEYISVLQEQYFEKLSAILLNRFSATKNGVLSVLEDPVFITFFKEFCKQHQIIEYYLLDVHGSFLLLNNEGRPSWLAVADEEYMKTFSLFAESDEASADIITVIKNRTKMPFFFTEDDFYTRPAEWQPYLHPAKILKGAQIYYYAYIDDPDAYQFQNNKIVSYHQFLEAEGH